METLVAPGFRRYRFCMTRTIIQIRDILAIFSVFIFILFSGCSTIDTQIRSHKITSSEQSYTYLDLESDCLLSTPNIYSGTVQSFQLVLFPFMCPCLGESGLVAMAFYPCLYLPLYLIDLTLCVAADTLILPYTTYRQIRYGIIEPGCDLDY